MKEAKAGTNAEFHHKHEQEHHQQQQQLGDTHVAKEGEKWEFDQEVTKVFPDMISSSIPGYDSMRSLTTRLAQKFLKSGACLDLGSSLGGAVSELIDSNEHARFVLTEISQPMLEALSKRYKDEKNVDVCEVDLRNGIVPVLRNSLYNVVLCNLTLMFVPVEYRFKLVRSIYRSMEAGGIFLLVEKTLGNYPESQELLVEQYLDLKRLRGYTEEQILRKRLALEGVLVPVTQSWNEDMLKSAGFKIIDCYWRALQFTGTFAIKE
jgi:tRNA (cmo5U34)-methyltransferase